MKLGLKKALVALGMATTAFAGLSLTAGPDASAAGTAQHGCAYGNVCIYQYNSGVNHWASNTVDKAWNAYDTYYLTGYSGNYYILNNQSGTAKAGLCTGISGTGSCYYYSANTYAIVNMTPYYSIKLVAH